MIVIYYLILLIYQVFILRLLSTHINILIDESQLINYIYSNTIGQSCLIIVYVIDYTEHILYSLIDMILVLIHDRWSHIYYRIMHVELIDRCNYRSIDTNSH